MAEKIEHDDKPRVEVCFSPNLYTLHKQNHKIVVVIDVLRATSAICAAFHNGVKSIIPVSTLTEAFEYKKQGYLVAAERNGEIVDGFEFGNSPYSYMTDEVKGKEIVLSTTNGTKCIKIASDSEMVVIGSLNNLDAVCEFLIEQGKDTMILCSGWKNKFNLEDTICAGAIAEKLLASLKFRSEEDSSVAAKYLFLSAKDNYHGYLKSSSHRKRLKKLNLNEDVKYCLTPNLTNVVPVLKGKKLVLAEDYHTVN
jgi:2-phosphosulfolactate phosphatase